MKRVVILLTSLLVAVVLFAEEPIPSSVSLPFFDDFAYPTPTPTKYAWQQPTDAVVTRARAHKSPTRGVLTLDAALANSLLYPNATTASFSADELTSLPINIEAGSDSLYLSFQFQPGGDAEPPARGDSLLVDFYDPTKKEWVNVWGVIYLAQRGRVEQYFRNTPRWPNLLVQNHPTPQRHFFKAHIPLRDKRFVQTGFQFRFRNLASIVHDNTAPGRTANSSQWHVDMVYLNSGRTYTDTLVYDVACTHPLRNTFSTYSAVPQDAFGEYLNLRNLEGAETLGVCYANLGTQKNNIRRTFEIRDLTKKLEPQYYAGGNVNILPRAVDSFYRAVTYPWQSLLGSDIHVRLSAVLQTDKSKKNLPFRWNDTVHYELHCTNEYAYDQGEPTSGYGFVGVGSERAAVAVYYRALVPTAIRAVRMWFRPIADLKSRKKFRLCVWRDNQGTPGQKLYEQIVTPPSTPEHVGKFYEIPLTTPLLFQGSYFIGWEQISADMLNVGYDAHTPYQPATYIRTGAQWEKSKLQGALMLRLVCGGTGIDPEQSNGVCGAAIPESKLYPNPAAEWVTLQTSEPVENIAIYSMQGHLVRDRLLSNESIDVSQLPAGLYFVRIVYSNGAIDTQKLIIK